MKGEYFLYIWKKTPWIKRDQEVLERLYNKHGVSATLYFGIKVRGIRCTTVKVYSTLNSVATLALVGDVFGDILIYYPDRTPMGYKYKESFASPVLEIMREMLKEMRERRMSDSTHITHVT